MPDRWSRKASFTLFARSSLILCVLAGGGQRRNVRSAMGPGSPRCINPQTQLLGTLINCPCIHQGPPYFFSSSSGERSRNSAKKKHQYLKKRTNKTQSNKSQKQGASPSVMSPHLIAWLNSCRSDACWKVYRPLLNRALSEMDEIQWWQINAASYLMAPPVNNSARPQVHCLCDSSWFLRQI